MINIELKKLADEAIIHSPVWGNNLEEEQKIELLGKAVLKQQEIIELMREALSFYAKHDNWDMQEFIPDDNEAGKDSCGKKSRKALDRVTKLEGEI